MKNKIIILLFFTAFVELIVGQSITERYSDLGEMFVPQLSTSMFPHSKREDGHKYKDKIFNKQEHYSDSSVAVFIPKGFKQTSKTNIVVYFHGWNNNIDSASAQFNLIEQFTESNKNAIFVFPEGPKNASDSFGGKLEDKNGLKNLLDDVLLYLFNKGKIANKNIGDIILAGHSGAYRVIAFSLLHGGVTKNISDVILFDALYAEIEKYAYWIDHSKGRFINIYTDSGGTKNEVENLMEDLDAWQIPYFNIEERDLKMEHLLNNRVILIHTDLTHNEVISKRQQLYIFLATSNID